MEPTISTLFQNYINECQFLRRLRPETLRGYREVFAHFCRVMPEVTEPKYLSEYIIIEFFKRIQQRTRIIGKNNFKTGVKDTTIRTYWSKLFSFFKWLQAKNLITDNPLSTLKPPNVQYVDNRALEERELHKIIAAITLNPLNSFLLKRDVAMFHVLAFCGLRKNEFISLKITDIDLDKRELIIRSITSKSKKTRIIPIHPTLAYHVKEYLIERNKKGYKSPELWINGNQDTQFTIHGLKHWVKKFNKLSGTKFHLHQFRHSFACGLAKKNVSAVKIQKLMGHADIRMTMIYLRSLTTEDLREDIGRLSF